MHTPGAGRSQVSPIHHVGCFNLYQYLIARVINAFIGGWWHFGNGNDVSEKNSW